MVKHRQLMYKHVKKTFEILHSEITLLMDLYSDGSNIYFYRSAAFTKIRHDTAFWFSI